MEALVLFFIIIMGTIYKVTLSLNKIKNGVRQKNQYDKHRHSIYGGLLSLVNLEGLVKSSLGVCCGILFPCYSGHLRYVDEVSYRFNRKVSTFQELFSGVVDGVSKSNKLTYKSLIQKAA
jgi:hypothetical protein